MLAAAASVAVLGIDAIEVVVEVQVANGLPHWTLVGLAATAVKESRDRVQAALANSGVPIPPRRITVNLQPGDLPKTGTAFDLPIALAVMGACGHLPPEALRGVCAVGELGLDGQLRGVRGVLTAARHVAATGDTLLLVPPENLAEARRVDGVRALAPRTLQETLALLRDGALPPEPRAESRVVVLPDPPDLVDVVGQALATRALEVAAAGGHNLLLVGPPGAGKTMLARRLPGILPPLADAEALEVLAVHSVAGLLGPEALPTLRELPRPFRAPHHSVSLAGLVGGGPGPRPGEVSLAHRGVLFLDELSLFPRHTLEALRQPLEDGVVTIARATRAVRFPAHFMCVAASNPCPCGFAGCDDRPCRCSLAELARHRQRLSGPLADRIDLHVQVARVPTDALAAHAPGEPTVAVRARVLRARHHQQARYQRMGRAAGPPVTNATAAPSALMASARLAPDARQLLVRAADRLALSARGYHRVLRVARTLADLDDSEGVGTPHVAEALRYRPAAPDAAAAA